MKGMVLQSREIRKKICRGSVVMFLMVLSAQGSATDPLLGLETQAPPEVVDIIERHQCFGCHAESTVRIGPSYRMIAARHGSRGEEMVEVLAQKIIEGGAGNWGIVPMVAHENLAQEDARLVARWILQLEGPN